MWVATAGRSLRSVLQEWGEHSGWTIVWQSSFDYPIDASASYAGDFQTAAKALVIGFADAVPPPVAHVYRANQVLLIK
jgi:hypothetical protein